MSYRNSIKLLISNFSIVWKQLLYTLIISLICFSLTYVVSIPVFNLLKAEGVLGEIAEIFETIYTAPSEIVNAFKNAFTHLSSVLDANISSVIWSLFGAIVFGYLLFSILKYISYYNVTSVMHMKMTSFAEVGYTRSLISNFLPSLRFALSRIVYEIPFVVLKILILMLYLTNLTSMLWVILGLCVCMIILILISSIEISIFAGHASAMVEKGGDISAFKAFFVGNKFIFKKYDRVFSNSLVVYLTLILINVFLGLFTVGAGLIISVPATLVFKSIFSLAVFYGCHGDRYYLAENTIVNPSSK